MPFDNMKFSFKKPDGATPTVGSEVTEKPEASESEPMSGEEMGASVKAAMSSGGDALYHAICNIIDNHAKV